jgi:hypothetical protein
LHEKRLEEVVAIAEKAEDKPITKRIPTYEKNSHHR